MKIIASAHPLYGDGSTGDMCAEAVGTELGAVMHDFTMQIADDLPDREEEWARLREDDPIAGDCPVTYDMTLTVDRRND